jgi:hypothetical protein
MRFALALVFLFLPALGWANQGMNPDVSVNLLGLYQYSSNNCSLLRSPANGMRLQEAEIQFLSDVDPYLRASALFSISSPDQSPPAFSEFGIDPEEVFVETTSLPLVTLKMGKFKAALGKNNNLHTHAFPFIDAPLFLQNILGPEGFNDAGVSASVLLPLPWFSEITTQAFAARNEMLFNTANADAMAGVAHLKNLWEIGDSLTVESGFSGLSGPNEFDQNTSVWGADLTFKWRSVEGGKYHALVFGNEYLASNYQSLAGEDSKYGIADYLQWQFAQRWWVQARTEYFCDPNSLAGQTTLRQSALLAFNPSEFSGYRAEYDRTSLDGGNIDHRVSAQINITIGAHPAHAY